MLLANLPEAGLMYDATADGGAWYQSGIIRIMYSGVKSSLFPLPYIHVHRRYD